MLSARRAESDSPRVDLLCLGGWRASECDRVPSNRRMRLPATTRRTGRAHRCRRDLARSRSPLHGGGRSRAAESSAMARRTSPEGLLAPEQDVFANDEHVSAISVMGAKRPDVDVRTRVVVFRYQNGRQLERWLYPDDNDAWHQIAEYATNPNRRRGPGRSLSSGRLAHRPRTRSRPGSALRTRPSCRTSSRPAWMNPSSDTSPTHW